MKRRIIFYCEDSFLLFDLAGLSEVFHLASRESALYEVHFYSLNGGTVEANTKHPLLTTTIKELIDIQMILGADSVDFDPTQPLRDLVLKVHNQNSWKQLIPWIKGKIGRPLFVELLDNHMAMSPRNFTGHCHNILRNIPKNS
ncbi:hypothetical protein [Vibrio sp. 99-70-13A1]|uniref:hypothetical protein n=1 Tax=Vibrio sp. 99-70-13A1 TaxID=2607601 RepID=UPI00149351D5|nr:hypothetical protein [Vibrio sp. 99-70-13A1]